MKDRRPVSEGGVRKYYILTRPVRLSEMSFDEIDDEFDDDSWREKSRRLQARRWRKIRHQLA